MHNVTIRELALVNGFKQKEQPDGSMDLNPCVFDFAEALAAAARAELTGAIASIFKAELDFTDNFLDLHGNDPFMEFDCGRARSKRSMLRKLVASIGHQLPTAETLEFHRQCGEP